MKGNSQDFPGNTSDDHVCMKIDKQLRDLIKKSDLTVAQLSRTSGVSAKTIYNWLEGQKPRNFDQVKKVADYFEVSLDFICYGIKGSSDKNSFEDFKDEINAGLFEVILRKVKK
jgi:transcriptional regulator with XRE-family HTH domain